MLIGQIIIVLFWFIVTLFFYYTKSWRGTASYGHKVIITITLMFSGVGFLVTEMIFGTMYVLVNKMSLISKVGFWNIGMPILLLFVFALYLIMSEKKSKKEDKVKRDKEKTLKKDVESWFQTFNLPHADIDFQVLIIKNEPHVTLKVKNITREELEMIRSKEAELPKNSKLLLIPVN